MLEQEAVPPIEIGMLIDPFASAIHVLLPLAGLAVALGLLMVPLPGRGPRLKKRDPWRGFHFALRREVLTRAGHRCEGPVLLAWGRCPQPADEVDHIYPWSKGGATIASNGQALCRAHNRSKSNRTPPWWYVMALERRRRTYFPASASVRVSALMAQSELVGRQDWIARKRNALDQAPVHPSIRGNRRGAHLAHQLTARPTENWTQ